jgi:Ca-activated chloride channel family protein
MALRTSRLVLLLLFPAFAAAQSMPSAPITRTNSTSTYTLPVSVNEVNLTFNAVDENSRSIDDLQLSDLRLLDDGKKPARILDFQHRTNRQIRAGLLIDTSNSMDSSMLRDKQIASDFSRHILRLHSDQAFVTRFDFEPLLKQDWTDDSEALDASIHTINAYSASRLGGTAIFDSLYIACRDKFTRSPASPSGQSNFIMLFTDGIDNFSHARIQDVIEICQQTHTAIYVFSDKPKPSHDSGQIVLKDLAQKSGGRIFYDHGDTDQLSNLHLIEQDLRNDYILVYKPATLKVDGSFHHVKLDCPRKAAIITTRSGYYAPR